MSDLTCGPVSSVPYTPAESLVCEAPPPESLVCEAPPPPPKPPAAPKDQMSVSPAKPKGKSSSSFGFLDEAGQVCRAPEPREKPAKMLSSSDLKSGALDPGLFTANLSNSQVVASLDLELKDRDGLQNRSRNDIEGVVHSGTVSVNRDLFAPGLEALKGTTKSSGDTTTKIKNVSFDPKSQSYNLDLEVTKKLWKVPVWDNFRVQIKPNAQGEMVVALSDNWFPDKKILTQLEQTVRDTMRAKVPAQMQAIKLETEQQGNQLILRPQLKKLEVPLGAGAGITLTEMDSHQAKLRLDNQGHLHVDLKEVKVSGSSGTADSPPGTSVPDTARLNVQIGLGKDGSRQAMTNGTVQVNLDEKETPEIKMGHDRLTDYLKSGTFEGDISLYTHQAPGKTPEVQSRSQVRVKQADLGNGQKVDLETSLRLDFDAANGIRLDTLDHDYPPLKIKTTNNGVEFFVDGKEYYPEMKRLIGSAQESIALETFMFTEDAAGRELAGMLARKAAGLAPAEARLAPAEARLAQTKGVDVRFIFNSWKGDPHAGEASANMLRQASTKIQQEIDASGMSADQKAQAKANLSKNLNWAFFAEGILRSDHRKVLVVDGSQATVGGMNMGEHYLGEKGYHDVMVKMAGPEVRNVHREFLENWYEFRKEAPPADLSTELKSRSDLTRNLEQLQAKGQYQQKAGVQTLVTDDHQIDIERGLVKLIDEAQTELNIEQAFFSDETIVRHLAKAMQERNVKINVIVATDPLASSVFKPANLLSAYELAKVQKASGRGQINLHYYSHEQGGEQNHIHTKAISADGERAIVGSANMIGRSLSSPFLRREPDGQLAQAMYNKEMSLLLEGREFVQEIDERLFNADMSKRTKALDADGILKAVQEAGGEAQLRKQAVAAPFT